MMFGGRVFEKSLGHEGGAHMYGISALIRRDKREVVSLPCEHIAGRWPSANQEESSSGTKSASILTLGLPASRTMISTFLFFKPWSLWYFFIVAQNEG